jgi:hypothetical protein
VFDMAEHDGRPFIVMELLNGRDVLLGEATFWVPVKTAEQILAIEVPPNTDPFWLTGARRAMCSPSWPGPGRVRGQQG